MSIIVTDERHCNRPKTARPGRSRGQMGSIWGLGADFLRLCPKKRKIRSKHRSSLVIYRPTIAVAGNGYRDNFMEVRAKIRTLQAAVMMGLAAPLLAQGVTPVVPAPTQQPVLAPEPSANDPATATPMAVPLAAVPTLPPKAAPKIVKKKGPVDSLKPGQFVWEKRDVYAGPLKIVAVLDVQRIYVFQNDKLVGFSTISAGKKGKETPTGYFNILQKNIDHKSNLYSNAPMPFMQRLTWDGIALHGGHIPGYPASHGCIRMPTEFAKALYGVTQMDQEVVVLQNTYTPVKRPEPQPVPVIDPPVAPPAEQPVAPPMTPAPDPAVTPPASPPKPLKN